MILQFGAGNFLRAFADLFLTESGREPGCVTVVQSTGRERANAINAAAGRYHVAVQGFRDGEVVDDLVSNDYHKPDDPEDRNYHKSYGYLRTPEIADHIADFLKS